MKRIVMITPLLVLCSYICTAVTPKHASTPWWLEFIQNNPKECEFTLCCIIAATTFFSRSKKHASKDGRYLAGIATGILMAAMAIICYLCPHTISVGFGLTCLALVIGGGLAWLGEEGIFSDQVKLNQPK